MIRKLLCEYLIILQWGSGEQSELAYRPKRQCAEGWQWPLAPSHCKLMRDLLEAPIRRPLWRFGVARATAMM